MAKVWQNGGGLNAIVYRDIAWCDFGQIESASHLLSLIRLQRTFPALYQPFTLDTYPAEGDQEALAGGPRLCAGRGRANGPGSLLPKPARKSQAPASPPLG